MSAEGAPDSSKGPYGTDERVTIDANMHFELLPIIGALLTTGVISTLIWDWLLHPTNRRPHTSSGGAGPAG